MILRAWYLGPCGPDTLVSSALEKGAAAVGEGVGITNCTYLSSSSSADTFAYVWAFDHKYNCRP